MAIYGNQNQNFEQSFRDSVNNTGDIIIAVDKKPPMDKTKKLLIIVVIFAIVVLGGLFVLKLIMDNKGSDDGSIANIETRFNTYANLMISGEDSKERITGEYQYKNTYYMGSIFDEDTLKSYIDKVREKYKSFLEAYKKRIEKNPEYILVGFAPDEYSTNLELYLESALRPAWSSDVFRGVYINEDRYAINTIIDDYYSTYVNNEDDNVKTIGEQLAAITKRSVVEGYDVLYSYECFAEEGDRIANECLRSDNEQIVNALGVLKELDNTVRDVNKQVENSFIIVYEQLWTIAEGLYNE